MRPARDQPNGPGRLSDQFGCQPRDGGAGDGAADQPAAGAEVRGGVPQEGCGEGDVFEDFEERDHVVLFSSVVVGGGGGGGWEVFDGTAFVFQFPALGEWGVAA